MNVTFFIYSSFVTNKSCHSLIFWLFQIILYRDGVGDGQLDAVDFYEAERCQVD